MLTTTLNDLRQHSPCLEGWTKLLAHLGKTEADDEPLSFETILESNGLADALWCLRVLPPRYENDIRLLACDLASTALKYTTDPQPAACIETARRYARGEATEQEWASWAAAWAVEAARAARAVEAVEAARDAVRVEQEAIFRAWLAKA
jgi:hypothetical protein